MTVGLPPLDEDLIGTEYGPRNGPPNFGQQIIGYEGGAFEDWFQAGLLALICLLSVGIVVCLLALLVMAVIAFPPMIAIVAAFVVTTVYIHRGAKP